MWLRYLLPSPDLPTAKPPHLGSQYTGQQCTEQVGNEGMCCADIALHIVVGLEPLTAVSNRQSGLPPKKLQRFYCKPSALGMNWGKSASWGRIQRYIDNHFPFGHFLHERLHTRYQ